MHIYAFGSVCRGEIDQGSDIDLLACINNTAPQIDREKYSIYQYDSLKKLWEEGNPFAWHLYLESKLLFSPDGCDFLRNLGKPGPYLASANDYAKFKNLFDKSYLELAQSPKSTIFHLSCIFLAIRNFATCYSLSIEMPIFSRKSPLMVNPPLDIDIQAFAILTRARLLSTRGYGENFTPEEISTTMKSIVKIPAWMDILWNIKK